MLTVRTEGRVAVLTLDRPDRLNALSAGLADALSAALSSLRANEDVRALVVAGAGRAFSAGADLTEIEACTTAYEFRAFVERLTRVFGELEEFPKPSVAAIHGFAFGGGLELALACDLRVAERGARLGLPEAKLGVLPGAGGTQRLPRLVPMGIAKEMILTGEPISAERGHEIGLVNELADPGEVLSVACGLAGRLAAGSPLALAAGKRLTHHDVERAVAHERETVAVMFTAEDRAEGLRAFRERRPGEFQGR